MPIVEKKGEFYLGKLYDSQKGTVKDTPLLYSAKDLTTHAVCVGMTGSGKTGLGITVLEEAALDGIPSIVIDPKGDMGNLLLTFPHLSAEEFKPWIDLGEAERKGVDKDTYAETVAKTWRDGLKAWGESPERIQKLHETVTMAIYTPASRAGIPLSILSSFKAPSKEFASDEELMRDRILSTTSSLLGLIGMTADPIKSREHILISTIIGNSWRAEKDLDLVDLIKQVQKPSFNKIGVLDLDTFFPPKERMTLAVSLNNLLAAPGFQAWMEGVPLEIDQLLYTADKKPKVSVISIAHLSDSERMFFVTLLLNQLILWMRKQPGTSSLRAIFYMDEIFGYFPPIQMPPSKLPMLTLLKQSRAFGLGMFLCTQNPVDLDYKGLSNCGTWFIGRLQTERDKMRVVEGLAAASNGEIDAKEINKLIGQIGNRVFIMRSIYEKEPILFQTRWALSYLRGPLTLAQIASLTQKDKKEFIPPTETKEVGKPMIQTGVPEYFVGKTGSYRPFIGGFAKLHFIDKKYNVDYWRDENLVVEADESNWDNAESHPDLKQELTKKPLENATYEELPSVDFQKMKKDLETYLYQQDVLKIFESKETKLTSSPDEEEEDFRQKVASAMQEKNDVAVEQVKKEYAKKLDVLNDKIRRAEEKKSTQKHQTLYQMFEAFLSMVATVIGALLGKRLTQTTVNQAGTTFRRMGRIGKESQDVTMAEENVQALKQQYQDTQNELEAKIAKIKDPKTIQLDEIVIRPRKTDISVEEIALIWWS